MAIDVRDSASNRPELILEAFDAIGRSKQKRAVFEAIYYHKKQVKTVAEIANATGLSRKQVLDCGIRLVRSGIADQEKVGSETAYRQISFFQHHKATILRLLDHPERAKDLVTKRSAPIALERPRGTIVKAERKRPRNGRAADKLKIAFLSTNPDPQNALRTDIEARNVLRAIQSAGLRDSVDIRYLPAATANDLANALNDFAPTVIHFGGHGGDEGLLFDDETMHGEGGVDIDFRLINKILAATDKRPRLVVFNACDTLVGAEQFLDTVEAVVAMSSSIGDVAAALFAGQFYRAIASKQSIASAVAQGKNAIEIAQLGDFDLPTPLVRDGLELGKLMLV